MRRFSFVAVLFAGAVAGFRGLTIPEAEEAGGAALATIVLAGFVATWCLFDGRIRGKPPVKGALIAIFLIPPVGFPFYCVWSRGARGVLFCLGFVSLLVVTALGATMVVAELSGIPAPG